MPRLFHVARRVALEQLEALYLNTLACQAQVMFKVCRVPQTEVPEGTSGINKSLLLR
jgi:hypothetical protein